MTVPHATRWEASRLVVPLALLLIGGQLILPRGWSQQPGPAAPLPGGGHAVVGGVGVGTPVSGVPVLPAEIQVVRIQAPRGVGIEVLDPAPTPLTVSAEALIEGGITVGLRVGVPYRLRLTNLPNRPEAELFPIIEVVGHLHRPPTIDPGNYPIRVKFTQDDLDEVVEGGRLVTQVVYLEAPEQAIPIQARKDELLTTNLNPAEDPIKVARALGRVMAIVRLGGRTPAPGESLGLAGLVLEGGPCPFASVETQGRCNVPCCASLVNLPNPATRPGLPRDEYLCDGGDHGDPVAFGGDGRLAGLDPRDSVVEFGIDGRRRILPTNTVCIFAPRFAATRVSVGPTQAQLVQIPVGAEKVERQVTSVVRQPPMRLAQNQAAELARHRARASGLTRPLGPEGHFEVRVLHGVAQLETIDAKRLAQQPGAQVRPVMPALARLGQGPVRLKSAEGTVVTGLIESAGQKVMAWKPQELAAVEVPPNKPGLAVIKQVSVDQALPGDRVTYVIRYKNIGNVPIRNVSIVDSLIPRLEYVEGTAQGPAGTVFTAAENRAGSVELRWDLPQPVAPGEEGDVRFDVIVR